MRDARATANGDGGKTGVELQPLPQASSSTPSQHNPNSQSSNLPSSDEVPNSNPNHEPASVASQNRRLPSFSTFIARTKVLLRSHHWWGFVILWILAGETESFSTNSLLALFMKTPPPPPTGREYTIPQLNTYPTGVPAVGVISTLFWATLTDALGGHREWAGYFVGLTGVGTAVMILVAKHQAESQGRDVSVVVFAAYYVAGAVYACQATFFAWCNDAMRREDEWKRAAVLAGMNMGSNAINAWWGIVFYGAEMAPWFERGLWAMLAVSLALVAWCVWLTMWLNRKEKERAVESEASAG